MQIVFGVRDANDKAYPIIERTRVRHPELDIAVVLSGEGRHPSPKVNNLEAMAPHAKYDLWWLSDSNTRVHPDTLASMVEEIQQPGIGAVVSPIVGDEEKTGGSAIENVHLNAFVATGCLLGHLVTGLAGFPGKSVLVHRDKLNALGSWDELGKYSGEDIILFKRIVAMGLKLVLGRHVVTNVSQHATAQRFMARHLRWAQIRWRTVPSAAFEPLLSPLLTALLFVAVAPSMTSLVALALGFVAQTMGDLFLVRSERGRPLPVKYWWAIWARLFLGLWVWFRAMFVARFEWRGNTFWMGPQSTILTEPPMRARLRGLRTDG
jgi:ceramide glucosyltransferase